MRAVPPERLGHQRVRRERAEPKHEERCPTLASRRSAATRRVRTESDAVLKLVVVVALLGATAQEPRARAAPF